jgi:PII-like signaling protein
MEDDVTVVRVYISEADHGRGKTLMDEVLHILHERVRGAVAFRGIAGFGSTGEVHAANLLRIMVDLPVVIEFFDEPAVAQAAIAALAGLVPAGHIICWRASCPGLRPAGAGGR